MRAHGLSRRYARITICAARAKLALGDTAAANKLAEPVCRRMKGGSALRTYESYPLLAQLQLICVEANIALGRFCDARGELGEPQGYCFFKNNYGARARAIKEPDSTPG